MYSKRILLFFILLILLSPKFLKAQLNVDSLEQIIELNLDKNQIDNEVVQNIKKIIVVYRYQNWERAYHYATILETLNNPENKYNDWANGLGLKLKGNLHLDKGEYQLALNYYYKALEFYQKNKNKRNIADMYSYIAYVYYNLSDFVTAKRLYENAKEINKSFEDKYLKAGYANNLLMLASISMKDNDYEIAFENSKIAAKIFDEVADSIMVVRSYYHIVQALIGKKDFNLAEEFIDKSNNYLGNIKNGRNLDTALEYKILHLYQLGIIRRKKINLIKRINTLR